LFPNKSYWNQLKLVNLVSQVNFNHDDTNCLENLMIHFFNSFNINSNYKQPIKLKASLRLFNCCSKKQTPFKYKLLKSISILTQSFKLFSLFQIQFSILLTCYCFKHLHVCFFYAKVNCIIKYSLSSKSVTSFSLFECIIQ